MLKYDQASERSQRASLRYYRGIWTQSRYELKLFTRDLGESKVRFQDNLPGTRAKTRYKLCISPTFEQNQNTNLRCPPGTWTKAKHKCQIFSGMWAKARNKCNIFPKHPNENKVHVQDMFPGIWALPKYKLQVSSWHLCEIKVQIWMFPMHLNKTSYKLKASRHMSATEIYFPGVSAKPMYMFKACSRHLKETKVQAWRSQAYERDQVQVAWIFSAFEWNQGTSLIYGRDHGTSSKFPWQLSEAKVEVQDIAPASERNHRTSLRYTPGVSAKPTRKFITFPRHINEAKVQV